MADTKQHQDPEAVARKVVAKLPKAIRDQTDAKPAPKSGEVALRIGGKTRAIVRKGGYVAVRVPSAKPEVVAKAIAEADEASGGDDA